MKLFKKIAPSKFNEAFKMVKWIGGESNSKKYFLWSDPKDSSIWTVIPKDENGPEYEYYQDKNIKMLLYALDLPENEESYEEIHSQLVTYNYKLINRIVSYKNDIDCVPFELANNLPSKNIDAFRSYFQIKTSGKHKLPIESFKLNHTRHGSFIIPISILAESNNQFDSMPSETNHILHEYLEKIEVLTSIKEQNDEKFVTKVLDSEIDSILVKDFLGENDSIAKYKNKYSEEIKELTISVTPSPFLDYSLQQNQKNFKSVNLSEINSVSDALIAEIQNKEVELNPVTLYEVGAKIKVIIDGVNRNGTAKFRVVSVKGQTFDKPFHAETTELPQAKLNICADAFKTSDPIEIVGDIKKTKGKVAKIVVDTLDVEDKPLSLFES